MEECKLVLWLIIFVMFMISCYGEEDDNKSINIIIMSALS